MLVTVSLCLRFCILPIWITWLAEATFATGRRAVQVANVKPVLQRISGNVSASVKILQEQLSKLPAQVLHQRSVIERFAGDFLTEFGGGVALPGAVDVFSQPVEQAAEFA